MNQISSALRPANFDPINISRSSAIEFGLSLPNPNRTEQLERQARALGLLHRFYQLATRTAIVLDAQRNVCDPVVFRSQSSDSLIDVHGNFTGYSRLTCDTEAMHDEPSESIPRKLCLTLDHATIAGEPLATEQIVHVPILVVGSINEALEQTALQRAA